MASTLLSVLLRQSGFVLVEEWPFYTGFTVYIHVAIASSTGCCILRADYLQILLFMLLPMFVGFLCLVLVL